MKTQNENPNGLHQKYVITKVVPNPAYNQTKDYKSRVPEFVLQDCDKDAEYFILRLDNGANDKKHLDACKKAALTYANEIKDYLPQLSKDLIERYSLKL